MPIQDLYDGDGSTRDRTITFPYTARSFVVVKVDDVLQVDGTDYVFFSDTIIRFDNAHIPSNGTDNINIQRVTSTSPLVDFVAGASILDTDLDTAIEQMTHLTEEQASEAYVDTVIDDATLSITSGSAIATGGVTNRTIQDRWGDVRSVMDFGAVGDGVADDRAAIQAAIDALPLGGGKVVFPPGTYVINAQLNILESSTHLEGSGAHNTDILMKTDAVNGIVVGDGSTTVQSVTLSNFRIRVVGFTPTSGSAIRFHGPNVSTVKLSDIQILACWTGIETTDCNIQVFEDISIANTEVGGIGILFNGSSAERNTLIRHVFMTGPSLAIGLGPVAGIKLEAPISAVRITDSDIIHHGIGVYMTGGTGIIGSVWIDNCFLDQNVDDQIRIAPGAGKTVNRIRISNSWISGLGDIDSNRGVFLDANGGTIDGVEIVNCHVLLNGLGGIVVQDAVGVSITGCAVAGNSQNAAGVQHGITVAANVDEFSIQNCRIGKWGSISGDQGQGIVVANGTSDKYMIQGNDLRGNASGAMVDLGSGIEKQIFGNIPSDQDAHFNIGDGDAIVRHLSKTASLNFPDTLTNTSSDQTIAVGGATVGDSVVVGVPVAAVFANSCYTAWVSASGVVTVRFNNYSSGSLNPTAQTFRVDVWRH